MQFYNFLEDENFNTLRKNIDAPLLKVSELLKVYDIEPNLAEQLLKDECFVIRKNIDIKNGLLFYKNIQVTLNLAHLYKDPPKLHISACKAIQKLLLEEEALIAVSRQFHTFRTIHFTEENQKILMQLSMCQLCFEFMRWDNFCFHAERSEKERIKRQFSLPNFYRRYESPQVFSIFNTMQKN